MYNDIKLEKGMYNLSGKSFTKFFTSTDTAVLFPEYVKRSIAKGFDGTVLSSVTAVKTVCESGQYLGCIMDDTAEYVTTAQSVQFPAATVKEGTTAVVLEKYGRLINASYEAVRKQRLDVFGVMLRGIGVKLAVAVVKKAMTVLAADAAAVTASSTASI